MPVVMEIPMSFLDAYIETRQRAQEIQQSNLQLPVAVVYAASPGPEAPSQDDVSTEEPEAQAPTKKARKPKVE